MLYSRCRARSLHPSVPGGKKKEGTRKKTKKKKEDVDETGKKTTLAEKKKGLICLPSLNTGKLTSGRGRGLCKGKVKAGQDEGGAGAVLPGL